ncbi:hypothetical protein I0P70_02585 [Pontibacter sp. FD36]|nr:hypothetical protein [Pontibacter sp. FD36]
MFSSCEEETILPAPTGKPSTGTPTTTPPTTTPPNNQGQPPVTTNSLLKQLGTRVFRYDAQNRLVELSYTDQHWHGYTVIWEGNKPVRLNFKGGEHYLLYTYEGDKVIEAITYSRDQQPIYHYTYAYEGDRLVKEVNISYATSAEGRLHVTDYKYDGNGNLTELVQAWSTDSKAENLGRPVTIAWGAYDDKPNPLPYVQSTMFLPGVKLFQNNPGFRDEELYTYSYHESGMPKQRFSKLKAYPHVPAISESYQYE